VQYHVRAGIGAIDFGLRVIGLLTSATLFSVAQTHPGSGPASIMVVSAPDSARAADEIVREIDDPTTGDRWLLERDSQHPGGPGRMVLAAQGKALPPPARASIEDAGKRFETNTPVALIRSGDRLIVEEHTRLVDAVLEAIALVPAREGEALRVRLSIGGRVMNAVAIAPGRALLSSDSGAQP
jgi:hypothetical protein